MTSSEPGLAIAPATDQAEDLVERFTRRPSPATAVEVRPTVVVVVPPRGDRSQGFDRALGLLRQGRPAVRLVGMGVTSSRSWPRAARDLPGLWTTELSAYRAADRIAATRGLRAGLATICDQLFSGLFDGLTGRQIFYPQIGFRCGLQIAFALPLLLGFARYHRDDEVVFTEDWALRELLAELMGRPPRRSGGWWRVAAATLAIGGWVYAGREVLRGTAASRRLVPPAEWGGTLPKLWVQLAADWPRINHHLVRALDLRRRSGPFAALLFGAVGRGERSEHTMKTPTGQGAWPGLAEIEERLAETPMRVLSQPTSYREALAVLGEFSRRWVVATWRLATGPAQVDCGGFDLRRAKLVSPLAKLITLDLVRASIVEHTLKRALEGRTVEGTTIVFSGAHAADAALVARRLSGLGARTVDFAHGWSGEPVAFACEPGAAVRCVWSSTDVPAVREPTMPEFAVAGMTIPAVRERGWPRPIRRVLIMSNYSHRDDVIEQLGQRPYQDQLLAIVEGRDDLEWRWRPHPADSPPAVEESSRRFPNLVLSRDRPLQEDLEWADLAVSSMSTTLVEALFADVPVIAHLTPDMHRSAFARALDPMRIFFYAEDFPRLLEQVIRAAAKGAEVVRPDAETRRRLFGPSGRPSGLCEALGL